MTSNNSAEKNADYYERLKAAHVAALWTIPGTLAAEPTLDEVPYVWHATDVFPLLREAIDVVDLGDETDRRALNASNPKRIFGTSHNLVAGYQLVLPGETAPAHRHSPSAIRLLLEGSGHTTVDGEPVFMERGDLVLTPPYAWHDHRHEGTVPMIWLDGLDVPFVRGQHAQFAEEYENGELQALNQGEDASVARYGAGMIPAEREWTKSYSPLNKYPYKTSKASLLNFHASEGQPSTGSSMEYVNPITGGPVIPTITCFLTVVPEGQKSKAYRHTPSKVFCVLEGSGYSIINGERYDWEENDFFVVPSWHWYEHHANEGSDAILFSMSDRPIYEPFGLLREQVAPDAPVKAS
ncbi:gentisate 1,2-dioxygenase [Leifsonia kafniensis]|uniref:Gentisate 1,2-dioxygenase n=1 Tax=Leifsonia kafniensis TaxID=475957 RepID=A0ABP7KRN8_9MICO